MLLLSGTNTHSSNNKYLIFNVYICLHFLNEEYVFEIETVW